LARNAELPAPAFLPLTLNTVGGCDQLPLLERIMCLPDVKPVRCKDAPVPDVANIENDASPTNSWAGTCTNPVQNGVKKVIVTALHHDVHIRASRHRLDDGPGKRRTADVPSRYGPLTSATSRTSFERQSSCDTIRAAGKVKSPALTARRTASQGLSATAVEIASRIAPRGGVPGGVSWHPPEFKRARRVAGARAHAGAR
jgi:hypothetical protein